MSKFNFISKMINIHSNFLKNPQASELTADYNYTNDKYQHH